MASAACLGQTARLLGHRRKQTGRVGRSHLQVAAAGSTFGHSFRVTTFGESHGGGVGCVIDGVPPRMQITKVGRMPPPPAAAACAPLVASLACLACTHRLCIGCSPNGAAGLQEEIQFELDRRRPGQSKITTPRKETDTCELLSGMAPDGTTTLGTPICVLVRNQDQKSQDYTEMELAYRPSHAGARQRTCLRGMASQPSSQQRNHAAAPVSCQSISACCITSPPINCLPTFCRCHL